MERRKFIQLTGLGATGLSLHLLWDSLYDEQSIYSFPQMVGEVSQTSAILQTRLAAQNKLPDSLFDTSEVLVSQDIPGAPGIGRFEIADNARFDGAKKTPWQRLIRILSSSIGFMI